ALNKAEFVQPPMQIGQPITKAIGPLTMQEPDHRRRWLLRTRDERPCSCRATDCFDELAPPHSITRSARPRRLSGKVRPSTLAVLRLMTNWILAACSTGRSIGWAPLRIFPV